MIISFIFGTRVFTQKKKPTTDLNQVIISAKWKSGAELFWTGDDVIKMEAFEAIICSSKMPLCGLKVIIVTPLPP